MTVRKWNINDTQTSSNFVTIIYLFLLIEFLFLFIISKILSLGQMIKFKYEYATNLKNLYKHGTKICKILFNFINTVKGFKDMP